MPDEQKNVEINSGAQNSNNERTSNNQHNNNWKELPIFYKVLIILGSIAFAILILLPGALIVLGEAFPQLIETTELMQSLLNGIQVLVGIISLVLAITSIVYSYQQDKKITNTLEKLTSIEHKIDMSNSRKSVKTSNTESKDKAKEK